MSDRKTSKSGMPQFTEPGTGRVFHRAAVFSFEGDDTVAITTVAVFRNGKVQYNGVIRRSADDTRGQFQGVLDDLSPVVLVMAGDHGIPGVEGMCSAYGTAHMSPDDVSDLNPHGGPQRAAKRDREVVMMARKAAGVVQAKVKAERGEA